MNDEELKQLINSKREIRVGCMVRLLRGGECSSLHGFQDGEIYLVTNIEEHARPSIRITLINERENNGYCNADQLEVLT